MEISRMNIKILKVILVTLVSELILMPSGNIYAQAQGAEQKNLTVQKDTHSLVQEMTDKKLQEKKEDISALKEENADLKAKLTNLTRLNAQLEEKTKELYLRTQDFNQMKGDLDNLRKASNSLNRDCLALKKENKELKKQISSFKYPRQNEEAKLYEELGTAYTQAKLFDLAIDAYIKSLSFNSRNAQVHYNLGLLYKHSQDNYKKSVYHFKKYLALDPQAKNRKEVEYLIKMLIETPKHEIE